MLPSCPGEPSPAHLIYLQVDAWTMLPVPPPALKVSALSICSILAMPEMLTPNDACPSTFAIVHASV